MRRPNNHVDISVDVASLASSDLIVPRRRLLNSLSSVKMSWLKAKHTVAQGNAWLGQATPWGQNGVDRIWLYSKLTGMAPGRYRWPRIPI